MIEGVKSRMMYLIHFKNIYKCHNVPPPSTTTIKKERKKKEIRKSLLKLFWTKTEKSRSCNERVINYHISINKVI
jgi:hypothetical protein